MNNTRDTEARLWAVLAHLSVLGLGIGIPLPVVGWSDQRRKSNYATFQSLQALGYQSLGFTIWGLSNLVIVVIALVILMAGGGRAATNNGNSTVALGPALIAVLILLGALFLLYFLLPIIAAVACGLGKDFRYPLLGDRLARYLDYEPTQPTGDSTWLHEQHEFRWVAAMGHFSILIALWGMLAPLTTWMLYGKRSVFLRFQSIQTLVYQAGTTLLLFGAGFVYLFGFLLLIPVATSTGQPNLNLPTGIFGIVLFGLSLLLAFAILLIIPLFHIIGQWAGYRVLKGDNYRYPLVGRLVDQWMSKNLKLEEKLT